VVDALNRRVHELHDTTISICQTDIKGKNCEAAKEYFYYMELVTNLRQGKMQQKVE
jgi:hypothetical protein